MRWPQLELKPSPVPEGCVAPEEVWLARACAEGDRAACEVLEREYLAALRPIIRRVHHDEARVDEVLQSVRERLLVPVSGLPPRLLAFEGAAPLDAWLRAVATRLALNALRERKGVVRDGEEVLAELSASGTALDVKVLRATHDRTFREAFHEGFRALSARERNVLRLQVVDGLSLEQIGRLYAVNKSSVSRWLADVHAQLERSVRAALGTRLKLAESELDSFIDAMRSQLSLTSAMRSQRAQP